MAQRLARLRRGPQHDLAASFQRLQFLGPLAPQKRLMAIEGGHGRRVRAGIHARSVQDHAQPSQGDPACIALVGERAASRPMSGNRNKCLIP